MIRPFEPSLEPCKWGTCNQEGGLAWPALPGKRSRALPKRLDFDEQESQIFTNESISPEPIQRVSV